jgi:acyl-CoA thioesterase FadM
MSEANIAPGIGFVIGSLNIRYLDGAKENESLEIRITSGQASNKSCSLQYEVSANRRAVAQAETVIVFVNTLTLKPSPVPERFLEMVKPKPEEENLFSFLKSRL